VTRQLSCNAIALVWHGLRTSMSCIRLRLHFAFTTLPVTSERLQRQASPYRLSSCL